MNDSFSHDILIEIIKNLSNSNEANKVIGVFYKSYEEKNADGMAMGEIPQFNRLVEDALSMLLAEYEGREGKDAKKRDTLLGDCYAKIAGKEGTTDKIVKQISVDDIDTIIRKWRETENFDNDAIVNIICRKYASIVDEEELEKLIQLTEEEVFRVIKAQPEQIDNPNVFKLFEMLVRHYEKREKTIEQNDSGKKIKNIVDVAAKVKEELGKKFGENSDEYRIACEELFALNAKTNQYTTMTFGELKEMLRVELLEKIQGAQEHESEGNISVPIISRSHQNEKTTNFKVMNPVEKLEKLSEAVGQISKENPDKNIGIGTVMCEKGSKAFNDFYVIQILGAHCYVVEKFDAKQSTSLYIVDSTEINEVFQLLKEHRSIMKTHPSVIPVNHTKGEDTNYVKRIKEGIECSMQKETLDGLWKKAYEKEAEIEERKAMLGNPETTEGVEDRQEMYAVMQYLERQYEAILKQIEAKDKVVTKQDQERARKAERYLQKGGQQIDRA